jgi:DNA-binding GntR family transcriptional regulator
MMKNTQMLQDKAYNFLIEQIKNGELENGKFYSLNQFSKDFNFSKTPLRDAVLRLDEEGYLDLVPSKGFCVHELSEQEITETYQIREAFESYCLEELSNNQDTERGQFYLNKLQSKIDAQQKIFETTGDHEAFAQKDYEFHRSMIQYVGNAMMLSFYRKLMYRISRMTGLSFERTGRMKEALDEHIRIMNAVKEKNIPEIKNLICTQTRTAKAINLDILKTRSQDPA